MNRADIEGMTVLELRKLAKEHKIPLRAGINKAEIVDLLSGELKDKPQSVSAETPGSQPADTLPGQQSFFVSEPAEKPAEPAPAASTPTAPAPAASAQEEDGRPQFKAAWHNPTNRYSNPRQGGYAQRTPQARSQTGEWPPRSTQDGPQRQAPRSNPQPHRFGPDTSDDIGAQADSTWRDESSRPATYNGYSRGGFDTQQDSDPNARRSYTPSYRGQQRQGYDSQRSGQGYNGQRSYGQSYGSNGGYNAAGSYGNAPRQQQNTDEWVNPAECPDVSGVFDLHPDGYGFLRSMTFVASSRDLYVAAPVVKRFGLRSGDMVAGKVKPQRDGEKYASLLTVSAVNDVPADVLIERPSFDDDIERLGADYPLRRFKLDAVGDKMRDIRVLDLVAPIGFGQRALLLCPQDAHRTVTLRNLANAITAAHPEAEVLIVLFGGTPEEATRMRDHVSCRVLASTFDQPAENQLRMCDLVLDYAKRRVELKKDVVLLVDSLTKLSKACPTAAAMQGRAAVGVVNPGSLNRAKRLFGTANAFRAGGSLTVVGVMTQEAARVDEAIYEEFKAAANCILTLDAAIARAGVYPALNIAQSGTRKPEYMLSQVEMESLKSLRAALANATSLEAIQQLLSMVDRVPSNAELRQKLPDWLAMMRGETKSRA